MHPSQNILFWIRQPAIFRPRMWLTSCSEWQIVFFYLVYSNRWFVLGNCELYFRMWWITNESPNKKAEKSCEKCAIVLGFRGKRALLLCRSMGELIQVGDEEPNWKDPSQHYMSADSSLLPTSTIGIDGSLYLWTFVIHDLTLWKVAFYARSKTTTKPSLSRKERLVMWLQSK